MALKPINYCFDEYSWGVFDKTGRLIETAPVKSELRTRKGDKVFQIVTQCVVVCHYYDYMVGATIEGVRRKSFVDGRELEDNGQFGTFLTFEP